MSLTTDPASELTGKVTGTISRVQPVRFASAANIFFVLPYERAVQAIKSPGPNIGSRLAKTEFKPAVTFGNGSRSVAEHLR
jgi:hypothetical protein